MVNNPCAAKEGISYLPPMTLLPSAANMRSLHIEAFTHDQLRPRASALCVVLSDTGSALLSLCSSMEFTHPPSCLPSLGAALLSALLAGPSRYGTMKALTPAPLTYDAGLPVYLATPSCRSVSNHVGCLDIAYPPRQRAQRFSDFAMNEQARRSSPPNRVRYPTDRQFASGCSPPRLAATQLPSTKETRHSPARTSTAPTKRPHGRTHARAWPWHPRVARRRTGESPRMRRQMRSSRRSPQS
jgi:hypothetical protein